MVTIGLDLHKRESQLCIIAEDGSISERRTSRRWLPTSGAEAQGLGRGTGVAKTIGHRPQPANSRGVSSVRQ